MFLINLIEILQDMLRHADEDDPVVDPQEIQDILSEDEDEDPDVP